LIQDIKEHKKKTGEPFLAVTIADKTGALVTKIWDMDKASTPLKTGEVVGLSVDITEYKGQTDGKINGIVDVEPWSMNDFLKASVYDPEEMWSQLQAHMDNFNASYFKDVTSALFTEENKEKFKLAPAATGMHHAFYHGLLEHTVQMLDIGATLLSMPFFAKELNRDLCMFGLMFHDFGKIFEYSTQPGFKKLPYGYLVGHIPMVAAMIYEAANGACVPQEVRDHMMHVVLAHHRLLQWGSPGTPSCPEAVFVHHVDNLHGDTFGVLQAREAGTGETVGHGYGDQKYTILKKSFNEVMAECEGAPDGF
jgi:3'-5' exoribonuclease